MSYVLRMYGEMHDWLTELRDSDPQAARLTGEALTALMSEGSSLGPPLVTPVALPLRPPDLTEMLDWSYQLGMARMRRGRRRVADAVTTAERLRRQVAELESLQARLADQHQRALEAGQQAVADLVAGEQAAATEQLAGLRPRLAEVSQTERRVNEESRCEIRQVEAFRTRKEVLKARYVAAQAEAAVPAAAAEAEATRPEPAAPEPAAPEPAASEPAASEPAVRAAPAADPDDGDGGHQDTERDQAAARLREVEEEIERELRRAPWTQDAGDLRPSAGLMQLRPGAPGADELRILFAVEPPSTALLLAVLEGRDAITDHYDEAVSLSSELLRRIRAGQAPEETAYEFAEASRFLDEFFAGAAGDVEAGAAALAAANRARALAELRDRLGLSRAEVADRMGVRPERVAAIERAGPGATEVRALAGYVEALGGQLEIVADVGGEQVRLH